MFSSPDGKDQSRCYWPRGLQSNSKENQNGSMQADAAQHLQKRKAPTPRMDHLYRDLHNTPDEPSRPMQRNHQQQRPTPDHSGTPANHIITQPVCKPTCCSSNPLQHHQGLWNQTPLCIIRITLDGRSAIPMCYGSRFLLLLQIRIGPLLQWRVTKWKMSDLTC